jgi:hypothetical protein
MRVKTAAAFSLYAATGWLLCAMFGARVLGQMLQRWMPQPFLPPAEAFQGSSLPYGVLLSTQLVILAAMLYLTIRMQTGSLVPSRRLGVGLAWAGGIYMVFSVGRIAVGVVLPEANPWFRTWIPAFFHLVLAGFVLTVSLYHLLTGKGT